MNTKKALILGSATLVGLSREKLQRLSGLPPATFSRRMRKPDSLTIGELRSIVRATRMSDDVILRIIK